jgi:tetratricopeptide (TPR) repeat protein
MSSPTDLASELAKLLKGEIDFRDFPWLSPQERRTLGRIGMAMLDSGKPKGAQAAFGVLIDLEPEQPAHYLMYAHSASLAEDLPEAFDYFGKSIEIALRVQDFHDVAAEAFLGRGELLLRIGRTVEARADLADAATRLKDDARKKSIEAYLAS